MRSGYDRDDQWQRQDRRRYREDGAFTRWNAPEYQKAMRKLRRLGIPIRLAHVAAAAHLAYRTSKIVVKGGEE